MKYIEQLRLSVAWLNGARNRDSGWGLNPGQASSIVNTAEALYVLNKAQNLPADVQKSVNFLRFAVTDHPSSRGPFVRYFAFGILGLLAAGVSPTDPSIQDCASSLRQSQINSKGWPQTLHNQSARVFPTFLALWTLQLVEAQPSPETVNGLNWLLTIQKEDGGWGFTDGPDEKSNASCTAYALIVLKKSYAMDSRVQRGKQWLLDHTFEWLDGAMIGESVGGADWYHCNPVWAAMALVELGESALSPAICGTIAYFHKLFDTQDGSWRQSSQHVVNVRSIFWAVLALEAIRERLDLNDIAKEGISRGSHFSSSLFLGRNGFGVSLPGAAFAPVVLGISGLCVFFYLMVSSQPDGIVVINVVETKIFATIILVLASALLLWKWKKVVKTLATISITMLISIVVSIWFLENTAFINFLNIISLLLALPQIFLSKEK